MNIPATKKPHHGRNVKHLREMLGVKQEMLAERLNVSQQTISRIEAREEIEDDLLERIAQILNLTSDVIKKFSDEHAVNVMANTFTDNSIAFQYNFNPLDKIVELYERVLKEKQDKIDLLQKLLDRNS